MEDTYENVVPKSHGPLPIERESLFCFLACPFKLGVESQVQSQSHKFIAAHNSLRRWGEEGVGHTDRDLSGSVFFHFKVSLERLAYQGKPHLIEGQALFFAQFLQLFG